VRYGIGVVPQKNLSLHSAIVHNLVSICNSLRVCGAAFHKLLDEVIALL